MLPDKKEVWDDPSRTNGLNAPTGAWCSLTVVVAIVIITVAFGLNAPTGAWCSLTFRKERRMLQKIASQCTYRCVVLPDPLPSGAAV